jgi:hypothetical protein
LESLRFSAGSTSLLSKVLVAVIIELEVLMAGDAGEISDRLC